MREITVSTLGIWLFILLIAVCMWEMARNLWTNWGTSNFWVSSLVAALVGVLTWWAIELVAYLSAPKATGATERKGSTGVIATGGRLTLNVGTIKGFDTGVHTGGSANVNARIGKIIGPESLDSGERQR